jgi:membrane protein DedA with SNARE-associated domain
MNWAHFMLAVFTGRVLRFCILAALTIQFGPQVVELAGNAVKQHKVLAIGILLGLVVAALVWYLLRRKKAEGDAVSS